MGNRSLVFVLAVILLLIVAGCEGTAASAPPNADVLRRQAEELRQRADALDASATSAAQATRAAQDVAAQATFTALSAQATAQALDAQATAQARSERTTATAEAIQGMAQAAGTTATAEALRATATVQAAQAQVETTRQAAQAEAIQATAQAVQRRDEREQMTQPLRTFGPWLLLIAAVTAVAWLAVQLLPIVKAKLGTIRRDERGDLPLLALTQGKVLVMFDPTRGWGPATRLEAGEVSQPLLAEPEYQDGTTKRAQFVDWRKGGRPRQVVVNPARSQPQLPPGNPDGQWREVTAERPAPAWPTEVPLETLLDGSPSARHLALGVTVHDNGRVEVVKADMGQMVHVAVAGSSGWGKSVFLRALGYQLALSAEPVDLAMVDLEGVTFAPFARCERLLYPLADTERDALAIFQALAEEMDRRKTLFSHYPGVDSLAAYNARAGEPLRPIVCLTDEATALLQQSSMESAIRTLVLRARKYGLWMVLGGQSWKASVLDTTIRDQLASRVQFRAMSASQSRVLLECSGAERLDVAGRALAILPGRQMIEMQAPYISHRAIAGAVSGSGPSQALPEVIEEGESERSEQAGRIRELAARGLSRRQIAIEVLGYAGGAAYQTVKEVLEA
ncbi:MAG: DNA translocase FtsK [Anaerolineae bacterium]|nr:DNA translocase FtsK [Anaerolineae bacterium]